MEQEKLDKLEKEYDDDSRTTAKQVTALTLCRKRCLQSIHVVQQHGTTLAKR